ncbi:MAG: hypothetical protein IPG93_02345 [Burkholderiales bacterium]|nr:hypothetical protein [Burkholderiales bacterium]
MTTPKEVVDLVKGSGNNFHAKVARWFQSDGWHTTISPYYMDQTQNKAREIDLIAEKSWPIENIFGHWQGDVVVRLFIECKYVPSYSVFWFTDKHQGEAHKLVCSSGIFPDSNQYTNKHHYLVHSPKVAKLFASNVQKGQELEPFYKALNQALNALVSMRYKPSLLPQVQKSRGAVVALDFPVVVCSSFERLWGVDFFAEAEPQQLTENFQLEVRYAYADANGTSRDDYFLLDFVEFNQLSAFAEAIAEDAKVAAYMSSES